MRIGRRGARAPRTTWWVDGWDGVLGMNARNDIIARANPVEAIQLVDDKEATKRRLREVGAPVAETLAQVGDGIELRRLDPDDLPDSWACKPNASLGGAGIVLAGGRAEDGGGWVSLGGDPITVDDLADHVRLVIDGEFSPGGRDTALFEPLLQPHPDVVELAPAGLPDARVLCRDDEPQLAMLRLPTEESDGRANLHAGGIGAAVDLETGRITAAMKDRVPLEEHPDTGRRLIGVAVPEWDAVVDAAVRCHDATGLHYLGADIVVDAERGPLILEVNARPGLEIQNVTGAGLGNGRSS